MSTETIGIKCQSSISNNTFESIRFIIYYHPILSISYVIIMGNEWRDSKLDQILHRFPSQKSKVIFFFSCFRLKQDLKLLIRSCVCVQNSTYIHTLIRMYQFNVLSSSNSYNPFRHKSFIIQCNIIIIGEANNRIEFCVVRNNVYISTHIFGILAICC